MNTGFTSISVTRALWFCIAASVAFTGLIWLTGELWLDVPAFAERQRGAIMPQMWYPWQRAEPTVWTRASAWTFYALHQVAIWWLIWKAQTANSRYSGNLHWFNVAALAVNAVFITLHLVQTHIWYDGLAQDVPEFTSQASVVLMLVGILIIENQRRGMFFGHKVPLPQLATQTVRKYHGYYFSWGILYTFWYHPMDITGGHLLGFLYMFLLMLQGSLFFTRMHTNPRWTIVSEIAVVTHAVMVAMLAEHQGWAMFFAGFTGIFVVTQMHGLGLSKAVRWALSIGYIIAVVLAYGASDRLANLATVVVIPLTEYILVFIVSALVWVLARLLARRNIPG